MAQAWLETELQHHQQPRDCILSGTFFERITDVIIYLETREEFLKHVREQRIEEEVR